MSKEELTFHFGVAEPHHVDPKSYEIVRISPKMRFSKRSERRNDKFSMTAFSTKFMLPLRVNDKLMSDFAKVVNVGKKEKKDEVFAEGSDFNGKARMSLAEDADEDFSTFDREQNRLIVPDFAPVIHEESEEGTADEFDLRNCLHYTHSSDRVLGAVSNCDEDGFRGFITDFENLYEVNPLDDEYHEHFNDNEVNNDEPLHLVVKRKMDHARFLHDTHAKSSRLPAAAFKIENMMRSTEPSKNKKFYRGRKTAELSVFVDNVAYEIFMKLFKSERRMRFMLLSVFNGVQAVYHYPSLGEEIDFSIVYMEIHRTKKELIQPHGSEQTKALINFCKYQENKMEQMGATDDSHPNHWDSAILISGNNFWGLTSKKRKSFTTMGLSAVGGMCYSNYGCTIAEMGVKDHKSKPYPSAGFTSVFVIAHELGHNFGMHHDILKKNWLQVGRLYNEPNTRNKRRGDVVAMFRKNYSRNGQTMPGRRKSNKPEFTGKRP